MQITGIPMVESVAQIVTNLYLSSSQRSGFFIDQITVQFSVSVFAKISV